MILEDNNENNVCNGKNSDGTILKNKDWGKYTEEKDMRKETIKTPAKKSGCGRRMEMEVRF